MPLLQSIYRYVFNSIRFLGAGAACDRSALRKVKTCVKVRLAKSSALILEEPCFNGRQGTDISVRENAQLKIGGGVYFNFNCIVACRKKISIGQGSIFGPGCVIIDHDHLIRDGKVAGGYACKEIAIGKNVWCGANVIILKGAKIGDNAVIGAGSVITGEIPPGVLVTQKRENSLRHL